MITGRGQYIPSLKKLTPEKEKKEREDAYVINHSRLLYDIQVDLDPGGDTSREGCGEYE